MRRLLALLAAVGMVAASLAIRSAMDDDDDGGGGGRGGGRDDDVTTLVCAQALGDVCRGLADEVVVEDAARTAERLAGVAAREAPDAWLTFEPWPAIVDTEREQAGLPSLFGDRVGALASSPLGLLGPEGLNCDWRCLGEQAAGTLRLAWPGANHELGVLVLGAASAGWFGSPSFAANDLEQPEFQTWLAAWTDAAKVERSPAARRLQIGRAFADVATTYQAEGRGLVTDAAPSRKEGLALLYPEPVARIQTVLASIPGADVDDIASRAGEELRRAGWRQPTASTGLPAAGVLVALVQELEL